ncbi:MAG: hypothetical protein L3K08_08340 [Thermoplasmata archaeon]|nr:hypothetical protein [Thermoplasmata archaeon]
MIALISPPPSKLPSTRTKSTARTIPTNSPAVYENSSLRSSKRVRRTWGSA